MQCCYRCQGKERGKSIIFCRVSDMKMKKGLVLVVILLLIGGCVQVGQDTGSPPSAVSPTIVFVPSDSSYLLACVNELQGLKQKDFERYSVEAAIRLKEGDDHDTLRFICLTLHQLADYKQFKQGDKLLGRYIEEHPDASGDMQGLLVLFDRLEQSMVNRLTDRNKMLDERDELAAQVETLQQQTKQDQERIQALQSQIDELKNIENIIKNRERHK